MAEIDLTAYDLTTDSGQSDAISSLTDEMNSSTEASELLNYFNIATYGTITFTYPPYGKGYNLLTNSAVHGLGYPPAFIGFWLDTDEGNQGYIDLPSGGFQASPFVPNPIYDMFVDSQNIYASVMLYANFPNTTGGGSLTFFYYIFNLQMPS